VSGVFEFDVPDDVRFIRISVYHGTSFITGIGMGYTYELDEKALAAPVSASAGSEAPNPSADTSPSAAGETADWYTHMDGPKEYRGGLSTLDIVLFAAVAVVLAAAVIIIMSVRRRKKGRQNAALPGLCTGCGAQLPPEAQFCTVCGKPKQS
jgi:hypothetical protein